MRYLPQQLKINRKYTACFFERIALSDQRFLITYAALIFVCVVCLTQQLKLNRKYTTVKQWLRTRLCQRNVFFDNAFIAYFLMVFASVLVLSQRFLMT